MALSSSSGSTNDQLCGAVRRFETLIASSSAQLSWDVTYGFKSMTTITVGRIALESSNL